MAFTVAKEKETALRTLNEAERAIQKEQQRTEEGRATSNKGMENWREEGRAFSPTVGKWVIKFQPFWTILSVFKWHKWLDGPALRQFLFSDE